MKTKLLLLLLLLSGSVFAQPEIYRASFTAGDLILNIEILDDDLIHFEYGQQAVEIIWTSPMVAKTDYDGASQVTVPSSGVIETLELRLQIDEDTLCATVTDLIGEFTLSTLCPLKDDVVGLSLTQEGSTDIYGLGEQFKTRGGADGNWIGGRRRALNPYGNELAPYNGGNVGNAQFPVMYALGEGMDNYALFLDDVYQQYWDFTGDPFTVTTTNDVVRGYIMTGENLANLRRDYLELTGKPPVPPRTMFGLWVSEYGYENWEEVIEVLDSLKAANFPLDGIILDLLWFGGIGAQGQMGSLAWDETNFPNPADMITMLKEKYGVGIMAIEEPYVASNLEDYTELAAQEILVRQCAEITCEPVDLRSWWGRGAMVDWTNPEAAAWWHDNRRQHLIDAGVIGHWTDLGEPEDFDENAWYYGFPELNRHSHGDIHNVYNLLWSKSIWDAYERRDVERRPFILSRSGTSGSQRYGVAMWSGDIGGNLPSLAMHMNTQMHMSLSGVDYFGSDIGGFYRQADLPSLGEGGTYTVWLANSVLIDVPLRPHAMNLNNIYETAPSLIGDIPSNLANVQLRYELIPYLYTLAHRAYRDGEPLFPPLVYHFQEDTNVRSIGSQKMIGPDMMMATVTGINMNTPVQVYLPAGGWFNYYTHEFIKSEGEWVEVPVMVNGLVRVPLFVRDGAIIPQAAIDGDNTKLIFKIYSRDMQQSSFTLIEDDGQTMAYQNGQVMETAIRFDSLSVQINAANGTYNGAPQTRPFEVDLISGTGQVNSVSGILNVDTPLELLLPEVVTP